MLVLSRKLQQQIKIGDQITVTVLKVKGNTVRLGIDAPRNVRVVRGELPPEGQEVNATVELDVAAEVAAAVVPTAASDEVAGQVIAFRLSREAAGVAVETAETSTQVSADRLPLRQVRNRFGEAPLKQLVASCAVLAK